MVVPANDGYRLCISLIHFLNWCVAAFFWQAGVRPPLIQEANIEPGVTSRDGFLDRKHQINGR